MGRDGGAAESRRGEGAETHSKAPAGVGATRRNATVSDGTERSGRYVRKRSVATMLARGRLVCVFGSIPSPCPSP